MMCASDFLHFFTRAAQIFFFCGTKNYVTTLHHQIGSSFRLQIIDYEATSIAMVQKLIASSYRIWGPIENQKSK